MGISSGIIGAIIGLALFGTIFAYTVHCLGDTHQGYTWVLVVIGVAVTVIVSGFFIGWVNVLILTLLFAASGIPMALGDIYDEINRRARFQREQNERLSKIAEWGISQVDEVRSGNPKKTPS